MPWRSRSGSRRPPAEGGPGAEAPVLVLSSGHRCGSTLIQRFLCSHPDLMVWGEHNGVLGHVLQARQNLLWWSREQAEGSREEFARRGHEGWIPNVMPPEPALEDAWRALLLALFAEPARAAGRARWGFKEVRYGAHAAEQLRRLFPRLRVIHVTRDPGAVVRSLSGLLASGDWTHGDLEETLGLWEYVNRSFLDVRDADWVLSVRHEDVVADPEAFVASASALVGLDAGEFDASVFARPVRWSTGSRGAERSERPAPPPEALERLRSPAFAELARAYGYPGA